MPLKPPHVLDALTSPPWNGYSPGMRLACSAIPIAGALYTVSSWKSCDRSDVQEVEKTVMQSSEPESNRLSVKPTTWTKLPNRKLEPVDSGARAI